MKTFKHLSMLIGISTLFTLSVPISSAKAQNHESFSQCVIRLSRGVFTPTSATQNCLNSFSGRPINEEFSTCVNRLNQEFFTTISANDSCQTALVNSNFQFSNSFSNRNRRSNYNIFIIVPHNFNRHKPHREVKRECIHKSFNSVWPDVHCRGSSPSFQWRTIYFD